MRSVVCLFSLLRLALGTSSGEAVDLSTLKKADWQKLVNLSFEQGVAALAVDGLQKLYESCPDLELELDSPELETLKYEWFGSCFDAEQNYAKHLGAIEKLASLYNAQSIPMLLMKGYGLSLNYPVPNHRPSGDIDVYLYGYGYFGDQMVQNLFKCDVKQNEDKHSVFQIDGVSVENHACFVNDTIQPSLTGLNVTLTEIADESIEHKVGSSVLKLPSPMFNALFLPFHCAGHFVHGEATVRQLCDWACFVQKYGENVAWETAKNLSEKYGFWKFYCCMNGILMDYLGVSAYCLPDWPRNRKLEEHVLNEILAPHKKYSTVPGKIYRYFASRWKYRMVYKSNIFINSFRLAKSYLRLHDKDAVSIWEK